MANCEKNTINSNIVGFSIAEEECPRKLPDNPVWYDHVANSFSDFGGEITTVASDPINRSRQNQRGTITDVNASGGFSVDMSNAYTRELQGFFFANAREKPDTAPLNGTAVKITGVGAAGRFTAASGLSVFPVGGLVLASGFRSPENNGLARVTAAASGQLTTDATTVVETTPPSGARIRLAGFQFDAGDLALTVGAATVRLTSTSSSWADVDLNVGEWIFVGGDAANTRYTAGTGYGRVLSKTDGRVVMDNVAWVGDLATDNGNTKSIRVFVGAYLRNEKDPAKIIQRTYQLERTLGSDDDGVMSEYLVGATANELTLSLPLTDKHTADFSYMALDTEPRTGADGVKSGAHVGLPKQPPYNTSLSVFRLEMRLLDSTTLAPTKLFGYASDATITVNNNASATKAVGALGGIGVNVGNFVVGGNITAYFTSIEAMRAIRRNADVGFNAIIAQGNKGLVYDIPLLGIGGGRLSVEKDTPITFAVENFGAENEHGYTMSYTEFPYLPDIAMPS